MKQIEVTFDENGDPKVETSGFKGGECLKATADLEAALGNKVKDTKKAEFQQLGQQQQQRQNAR